MNRINTHSLAKQTIGTRMMQNQNNGKPNRRGTIP